MTSNRIDFKTITTREDLKTITEEELQVIKKSSTYHSNYLRHTYRDNSNTLLEILTSRAREISRTAKYKNLSDPAKDLLATNIVYHDTADFIKYLIKNGISYNQLYGYSRLISKTKKLVLMADELDVSNEVQLTSRSLNKLCNLFCTYYGVRDFNITLIKINEIVQFYKELYNELEHEVTPQQDKKIR